MSRGRPSRPDHHGRDDQRRPPPPRGGPRRRGVCPPGGRRAGPPGSSPPRSPPARRPVGRLGGRGERIDGQVPEHHPADDRGEGSPAACPLAEPKEGGGPLPACGLTPPLFRPRQAGDVGGRAHHPARRPGDDPRGRGSPARVPPISRGTRRSSRPPRPPRRSSRRRPVSACPGPSPSCGLGPTCAAHPHPGGRARPVRTT